MSKPRIPSNARPKATVAYIAKRIGVHPDTVRKWCNKEILECSWEGNKWRYFPDVAATLKRLEELGYPTLPE